MILKKMPKKANYFSHFKIWKADTEENFPTPKVTPAVNDIAYDSSDFHNRFIFPKGKDDKDTGKEEIDLFRRIRQRIVLKDGSLNITYLNVKARRKHYFADIYTTLVEFQWSLCLFIFAASFLLSWLGFAVVWWLIVLAHGDMEPENKADPNFKPCVYEIYSFTSVFLFSIETQHTIGYGLRGMSEQCPVAVVLMCLQNITGVIIQAFMGGVVFAKISRPKKRKQTLMFSRNAVICGRDGELCLLFRVGDMRKTVIVGAQVKAQFITSTVTREGELMEYTPYELDVHVEGGDQSMFFIWPMTVVHRITPNSPLYDISAGELLKQEFEIVVLLEGSDESTGGTIQARSSYLPSEVLWGHRLELLRSFQGDTCSFEVDFTRFHCTYEIETPLCSAKDLETLHNQFNDDDRSRRNRKESEAHGMVPVRFCHRPVISLADNL